jgi:hypothetical protein
MDCAKYIQRALDDHLLNTSVFTHLSVTDAHDAMDDVEKELTELFELYGNLLPEPEKIDLKCFSSKRNLLYETVLHYNQSPQEQCYLPYCILCGSVPEGFSKWLDYKMKSLHDLVPTYLRDSYQVLKELKNIKVLPPNVNTSYGRYGAAYNMVALSCFHDNFHVFK